MSKNWLIRTKSNHILGPVSKEKVIELYQNGSIKPDDEICSGNGYWFYIRESDLIDRYLMGKEQQSFNPISEAKDVLFSSFEKIPSENTRDDITTVGRLNLANLHDNESQDTNQDVAQPVQIKQTQDNIKKTLSESEKKKMNPKTDLKQSVNVSRNSNTAKQNYLKFIWYFAFILLFLAIYFRKIILRSFLTSQVSWETNVFWVMPEAHAQMLESSSKKKIF